MINHSIEDGQKGDQEQSHKTPIYCAQNDLSMYCARLYRKIKY